VESGNAKRLGLDWKKESENFASFFEELAKMEPKSLQMTVPERDNFSESNWIERREKTREAKNPITMRKPKLLTN
jgi:pheromone shutdown protein TraB